MHLEMSPEIGIVRLSQKEAFDAEKSVIFHIPQEIRLLLLLTLLLLPVEKLRAEEPEEGSTSIEMPELAIREEIEQMPRECREPLRSGEVILRPAIDKKGELLCRTSLPLGNKEHIVLWRNPPLPIDQTLWQKLLSYKADVEAYGGYIFTDPKWYDLRNAPLHPQYNCYVYAFGE